jgi:outer membrane protein TolC
MLKKRPLGELEALFMLKTQKLKLIKVVLFGALSATTALACADTLDDLIDSAYHTYPSIKSKQMAQNSAKKEILAAKLNFLPTISVSAQPLHRNYGAYEIPMVKPR